MSTLISVCVWFLPDIVMFLTSIIAFIVLRKLTAMVDTTDDIEDAEQRPQNTDSISTEASTYSPEHYLLLKRTGNLIKTTIFLLVTQS